MLVDGVTYEECPRCRTAGVVEVGDVVTICPTCEADGYVPHDHGVEVEA